MTKIIKINPENPEKDKITECANEIKAGNLVVFPTETIYGIGADAFNPEAIKRIFIAKGRPQDNPLIVHISHKSQLKDIVSEIPKNAEELMEKFWPGPLTLIMKKSPKLPNVVTANLDTVAVRMPDNKIALELIKKSSPIAAPSANLSGKPSPTNVNHVIDDMQDRVEIIIDGGNSKLGLESTVLSLAEIPTILRPGAITLEQLQKILPQVKIADKSTKAISPGMKYKHYAPNSQVVLADKKQMQSIINKYQKQNKSIGVIALSQYSADDIFVVSSLESLAKNLFNFFRVFDKEKKEIILVERVPETGIGLAIMNRLKKAAGEI